MLNRWEITLLRNKNNISQKELAVRSGVSRNHISNIENGVSRPSPKLEKTILGVLMNENTEIKSELERLREENKALKSKDKTINFKVSAKGGLSIYGLYRFPVTLYKEQWLKVLDLSDEIRTFIRENDNQLKGGS